MKRPPASARGCDGPRLPRRRGRPGSRRSRCCSRWRSLFWAWPCERPPHDPRGWRSRPRPWLSAPPEPPWSGCPTRACRCASGWKLVERARRPCSWKGGRSGTERIGPTDCDSRSSWIVSRRPAGPRPAEASSAWTSSARPRGRRSGRRPRAGVGHAASRHRVPEPRRRAARSLGPARGAGRPRPGQERPASSRYGTRRA